MTITALPTPPSNTDSPANFAIKAGAFVAALPQLVTQINAEVMTTIPAIVGTVSGAAVQALIDIPAAVALVDSAVAQTAAGQATVAKKAAESARDAALIQAGVYTTEALGRAAVADLQAFKVQGSGDIAALEYRRINSTTSVLIASYPARAAIINNRVLAAADNYAAPPAITAQTLTVPTPTSDVAPSAQMGAMMNLGHPATMAGVVRTLAINLPTALAGRTVEFYVLRASGANWSVLFATGVLAAAAAGVTTFSATQPNAEMALQVGDVVGAWVSSSAHADGIYIAQSNGPTIGPVLRNAAGTRLAIGSVIGDGVAGYSLVNSWLAGISITLGHEALFVSTRWANQANGYPMLDSQAKLPTSGFPAYMSDVTPRTAAYGVVTSEYDSGLGASKMVSRTDTAVSALAVVSSTAGGAATYPQNQLIIGWLNGSPGFLKSGVLTKLRFPPGGTRQADAKIQAWVVRPTTTPGASGSTLAFTLVAKIGEIVAADTTKHAEFASLAIPVQVGDMIAFRGINAGMRYGDGSAEYTNSLWVNKTLADTTLSALDAGTSGVVQSGRKHDLYAEVMPGPFIVATSGPGAALRLDGSGNIPSDAVRAFDAPWKGLSIGAVGTSITAGGNATGLNDYIRQAGIMLGCVMDNQGVGSSRISWQGGTGGGDNLLCLSATAAQLTAVGGSAAQSYENKVLGKNKDLWIFDHGYNDRNQVIGTIDSLDKSTFYGAYNVVLQALLTEKPTQQFMFITPHSTYSPFAEGYHATTEAIRTAILALGVKYSAPVLDFTRTLQLNAYQAASMLPDTVHPNDVLHARAARQLYRFINGI